MTDNMNIAVNNGQETGAAFKLRNNLHFANVPVKLFEEVQPTWDSINSRQESVDLGETLREPMARRRLFAPHEPQG